jgi:transcription elongation factor GreA
MIDLPITPAGYEALNVELQRRQQEERPNIIRAIAEARAHGDLSENAEYSAAKEAQGLNEGRIQELESMIARAKVIDPKTLGGTKVIFGATVSLASVDGPEEKKYQIVGEPEADVSKGRIAITSPLARAMIGKTVGDEVDVSAPGGVKTYEIIAIAFV